MNAAPHGFVPDTVTESGAPTGIDAALAFTAVTTPRVWAAGSTARRPTAIHLMNSLSTSTLQIAILGYDGLHARRPAPRVGADRRVPGERQRLQAGRRAGRKAGVRTHSARRRRVVGPRLHRRLLPPRRARVARGGRGVGADRREESAAGSHADADDRRRAAGALR